MGFISIKEGIKDANKKAVLLTCFKYGILGI